MKRVEENVEYEQWLSWANCATVIRPSLFENGGKIMEEKLRALFKQYIIEETGYVGLGK